MKILPNFLSFSPLWPFQRHTMQFNFARLTGFSAGKKLQINMWLPLTDIASSEYISITRDNAHAKHFMRVNE